MECFSSADEAGDFCEESEPGESSISGVWYFSLISFPFDLCLLSFSKGETLSSELAMWFSSFLDDFFLELDLDLGLSSVSLDLSFSDSEVLDFTVERLLF